MRVQIEDRLRSEHTDFPAFVERYRLRSRRDECGDPVVLGKFGHVYEHSTGRLGIVLEDSPGGASLARSLLSRRRKALAAGFELKQHGDSEAVLLFDPTNSSQSRLAIRLVGAKIRRRASKPSEKQLAALRTGRQSRLIAVNLGVEPGFGVQNGAELPA